MFSWLPGKSGALADAVVTDNDEKRVRGDDDDHDNNERKEE